MNFTYLIKLFIFLFLFILFSCQKINLSNQDIDLDDKSLNQNSYVKSVDDIKYEKSLDIYDYNFRNILIEKNYKNNKITYKKFNINDHIYTIDSELNILKYDIKGELLTNKKIDYKVKLNKDQPIKVSRDKNFLYISFKSGTILKTNLNGQVQWFYDYDKTLRNNIYKFNEQIIVIYSDEITSISDKDGSHIWSHQYTKLPIYQSTGGQLSSFLNFIYFVLPNNEIGIIDLILGDKHFSNFDSIELQSFLDNTNDKIHIYENYFIYLDEGKYLYTFDIIKNEFILNKFKIPSNHSVYFFNNALILKNKNNLKALNVLNGNIYWDFEDKIIQSKSKILNIKSLNKNINIFLNNGIIVKIIDNNKFELFNLKIKNINELYFENNLMFMVTKNNKTYYYSK